MRPQDRQPQDRLPLSNKNEVLARLRDHADAGALFVPFVGSGVSALSGVMMGQEFLAYLLVAIRKAVASPQVARDISDGLWPQTPPHHELDDALQWAAGLLGRYPELAEGARRYLNKKGALPSDLSLALAGMPSWPHDARHFSASSSDFLHLEGLRSLRDWRQALRFLARLTCEDPATGQVHLRDAPDQDVIDAFNVQLVQDKQPNLTHKVLAHLADPLRLRLVLTTNFDDLTERAFAHLRHNITVLEVPLAGSLPALGTLASTRVLIKLHGGKLQTRADESLDEMPSAKDRATFAGYLRHGDTPVVLLILGYSGSDLRCLELIKHALAVNPRLAVFWIAHTGADVERMERVFPEESLREMVPERVSIHRNDRPDLLLYETYQKLTKTLPAGGVSYRFAHRIAPRNPSIQSTDDEKSVVKRIQDHLCGDRALDGHIELVDRQESGVSLYRLEHNGSRVVIGGSGALRIGSAIFHGTQRPALKLWLELQEYSSPNAFFLDLMRTLALRTGDFQNSLTIITPALTATTTTAEMTDVIKIMSSKVGIEPRDWLILAYARDGAGTCSGWFNRPWDAEAHAIFGRLLIALARAGFSLLCFPTTRARLSRNGDKSAYIEELLGTEHLAGLLRSMPAEQLADVAAFWESVRDGERIDVLDAGMELGPLVTTELEERANLGAKRRSSHRSFEDILTRSVGWRWPAKAVDAAVGRGIEGDAAATFGPDERERGANLHEDRRARERFLFALALFRQSRHTSAFYCEAVYPCPQPFNLEAIDNDELRAGNVDGWVEELSSREATFYTKAGGIFWMHRDVRIGVQLCMERLPLDRDGDRLRLLGQTRARTHFFIGDWYLRSFLATRHTVPLLESIYHRLRCFADSPRDLQNPTELSGDSDEVRRAVVRYRLHLAHIALLANIKLLVMARPHAKYWITTTGLEIFASGAEIFAPGRSYRLAFEDLERQAGEEFGREIARIRDLMGELEGAFLSMDNAIKSEAGRREREAKDKSRIALRYVASPVERRALGMSRAEDWTVYREELESLGLDWVVDGLKGDVEWIRRQRTDYVPRKSVWLAERLGEDDSGRRIADAIALVSDIAYFFVRKAKGAEWCVVDRASLHVTAVGRLDGSRENWLRVAWLSYITIDLCRSLNSEWLEFETLHLERAHSVYSLALSRLGRFTEARRHLEEALAYNSVRRVADDPGVGVLGLRRAEGLLTQVFHAPEDAPRAALGALIDRAWLALGDSERALSATSHSSLWWSLYYRLRLHAVILATIPRGEGGSWRITDGGTALSCLRDDQLGDSIWKWLMAGVLSAGENHYRTLRIAEAFVAAASNMKGSVQWSLVRRERSERLLAMVCTRAKKGDDVDREHATALDDWVRDWLERTGTGEGTGPVVPRPEPDGAGAAAPASRSPSRA